MFLPNCDASMRNLFNTADPDLFDHGTLMLWPGVTWLEIAPPGVVTHSDLVLLRMNAYFCLQQYIHSESKWNGDRDLRYDDFILPAWTGVSTSTELMSAWETLRASRQTEAYKMLQIMRYWKKQQAGEGVV